VRGKYSVPAVVLDPANRISTMRITKRAVADGNAVEASTGRAEL
jgi:hypothetical protein